MEKAKLLLRNRSLDIETICAQCGYLEQSSVIRLFKAEVGVTPGKYRESCSTNSAPETPKFHP